MSAFDPKRTLIVQPRLDRQKRGLEDLRVARRVSTMGAADEIPHCDSVSGVGVCHYC
jgi:hypothetical protein